MWDFILILCILVGYLIILHLRWKKKIDSYLRKIKEEEVGVIYLEKMASIGTLIRGIANEIDSPLSLLQANLKILLQNFTKGEIIEENKIEMIREVLQRCINETSRIKEIIQNLLYFSSPSQGDKVSTDINKLLETTLRLLWSELKYKVDIVKVYPASSQLNINPNEISQVFLNIILNAAQAIKERGTIYIATYEDERNVFIKISDTGCGIPEENFSKIFEPFFTTKGRRGLSFSVSKQIINNYG
jgi:signal transduction histidine kinase